MGICWYCHWGWSKKVVDIYDQYAPIAGESAMHYGAAHIVWDDENFAREHIKWCLKEFEQYKRDDVSDTENQAVKDSLLALLELTDGELAPEPADYDDEHPERYPPQVEMAHYQRV